MTGIENNHWSANFNFRFANGKLLGVLDRFSHAEHESGLKSYPSRILFEKMEIETPQKGVFGHFWITVGISPFDLNKTKFNRINANCKDNAE